MNNVIRYHRKPAVAIKKLYTKKAKVVDFRTCRIGKVYHMLTQEILLYTRPDHLRTLS